MLVDFSRIFPNIERLFRPAGARRFYPKQIEDSITPSVNLLDHLVVHGAVFRSEFSEGVDVSAGTVLLNFLQPDIGMAKVPISLSCAHDSAAPREVDLQFASSGAAADPWGAWPGISTARTLATIRVPGAAARVTTVLFPTPPPFTRGVQLRLQFRGMVLNDDIQGFMLYLELPAELLKFEHFRGLVQTHTWNTVA